MQKIIKMDNSGENVFCVAGSNKGIRITLLGPQDQIIGILDTAIKNSRAVREIIGLLEKEKSSTEHHSVGKGRIKEEKQPEEVEMTQINPKQKAIRLDSCERR